MKIRIGLETHVQLNTESKMFCGCRNPATLPEEPEPNTLVCETCLGMPGSKPRTNREAFRKGLKTAIALNCSVQRESLFSRKTYFYPDMAKNFQITQYEKPLAVSGFVEIESGGRRKRVRIRRIQIEEDPARTVHVGGVGGSHVLVDYNRSGIPLIEIVTEPDLSSPAEARSYLSKLMSILEYLGVYDSSSKAVMKSDANISLEGGRRVEVKNITGAKDIEEALNYEILRQKSSISRGREIEQSTRMWNPELGVTQELRSKESEEDYGYILEPDLTPLRPGQLLLSGLKSEIPELPDSKRERFIREYSLSPAMAESLVSELDIAELFEHAAKRISPRVAGSWIAGYLKKSLNWNNLTFRESGLKREWITGLLSMFERGEITDRNAEIAIRKMIEERKPPEDIIKRHGLGRERIDLSSVVGKVLKKNQKALTDYLSGEEKAIHFLVGQVMKETRGKADAGEVRKAIEEAIRRRKNESP